MIATWSGLRRSMTRTLIAPVLQSMAGRPKRARRMSNELVVLVTAPDMEQARRIATQLVSGRLAACVNLVPTIESIYTWNDQTEVSAETLLIIKTTEARYDELEARIKALHQYAIPEIVAFRIERGLAPYLNWLRDSTSSGT